MSIIIPASSRVAAREKLEPEIEVKRGGSILVRLNTLFLFVGKGA